MTLSGLRQEMARLFPRWWTWDKPAPKREVAPVRPSLDERFRRFIAESEREKDPTA